MQNLKLFQFKLKFRQLSSMTCLLLQSLYLAVGFSTISDLVCVQVMAVLPAD